jgi:asparagine N-glycosylation enzyme membrane subunit Stt3
METAIPMSENTSYEGWGQCYETLNQNQYDYYKVTATKRGTYTLTTLINRALDNGSFTSTQIKGDKFHYNTYETDWDTKSTLKVYCVDKGDEFYVFAASGLNSYKLNYTIEESIDENDMEPNNSFDEATEISENTKMNGTIGYGGISVGPLPKDSEDFYKIVPSKNGKLIISFKEKVEVPENFINFYLKDTNGRFSGLDTKALTVNNQTFEIDCASPDKTYYAQLIMSKLFASNYPCCNAYEISWNMQDTTNTGCGFLDTADFNFNDGLNIFPNPATDTLQLKVKNNQTINQITIRDITGKTVMSPTFNNNTVDIKKLNSGIYFLQAKINDKTVTQKFIKK